MLSERILQHGEVYVLELLIKDVPEDAFGVYIFTVSNDKGEAKGSVTLKKGKFLAAEVTRPLKFKFLCYMHYVIKQQYKKPTSFIYVQLTTYSCSFVLLQVSLGQ